MRVGGVGLEGLEGWMGRGFGHEDQAVCQL